MFTKKSVFSHIYSKIKQQRILVKSIHLSLRSKSKNPKAFNPIKVYWNKVLEKHIFHKTN